MNLKIINTWYLSSFIISIIVLIPILTVFSSFFEDTTNYFEILKETFFLEYIFNSITLLLGVLLLYVIVKAPSTPSVPVLVTLNDADLPFDSYS